MPGLRALGKTGRAAMRDSYAEQVWELPPNKQTTGRELPLQPAFIVADNVTFRAAVATLLVTAR